MASDNEYRERQRQRAEARKKRERAQKLMIFRLCLAAAVILAVGILIWVVTRDGKQPGNSNQPQPNTPVVNTQPPDQEVIPGTAEQSVVAAVAAIIEAISFGLITVWFVIGAIATKQLMMCSMNMGAPMPWLKPIVMAPLADAPCTYSSRIRVTRNTW